MLKPHQRLIWLEDCEAIPGATQVLSKQQTNQTYTPHKRKNANETNKNILCAYLTTWWLWPQPGGNLDTKVDKVD